MTSYIWCTSLNTVTGAVLRHLRNSTKKDQITVAKAINLPTSTISKLESGSANITIEYVYMLCNVYEISLTTFSKLIELASAELLKEKVYVYVGKSDFVDIKDSTAIVHTVTDTNVLAYTGTTALLGLGGLLAVSPLVAPIVYGVGLVAASRLRKGNKKPEDKFEESKETKKERELELPLIAGQQVYKLLKDYLEKLDMKSIA